MCIRTCHRNAVLQFSIAISMSAALICACRQSETPTPPPTTTSSNDQQSANDNVVKPVAVDENDRREFDQLHTDYLRHCELPRVMISSNSATRLDCQAVRQMKQAGWRFVPLVVNKVRDGDFFLAPMFETIIGVDVFERYGRERFTSGQAVAKCWLQWWHEEGRSEYEQWRTFRNQ